jgi:hypothetical protein
VDRWRDRAWIGSISAFGDWWRARDALDTDIALQDGRWLLRAAAPLGAADVMVILPKAGRREVVLNLPANGAVTHALP